MDDKQPSPIPMEKTVIEVVSSASQVNASDGIQDSTVTTATSLPNDHVYITKADEDGQMEEIQNDIAISSAVPGTSVSSKMSKMATPLKMTVGDQVYDLMPIDSTDALLDNDSVNKGDKASPVMPIVLGGNEEGKLGPDPVVMSEISDDHEDEVGVANEGLSDEAGDLSLMKEIDSISKDFIYNSPFKSPITDCVVKIKR
jgi:hypothetical protein